MAWLKLLTWFRRPTFLQFGTNLQFGLWNQPLIWRITRSHFTRRFLMGLLILFFNLEQKLIKVYFSKQHRRKGKNMLVFSGLRSPMCFHTTEAETVFQQMSCFMQWKNIIRFFLYDSNRPTKTCSQTLFWRSKIFCCVFTYYVRIVRVFFSHEMILKHQDVCDILKTWRSFLQPQKISEDVYATNPLITRE